MALINTYTADTSATDGDKYLTVDSGGTTKLTDFSVLYASMFPSGLIMQFGGAAAPGGWLLCQGQAVSRTTYAALYAVVGTSYGVGDGSTTFNVPNLKGKVPVGMDTGDADFNTLGKTGGAKTHTLVLDEIPAHTHTVGARDSDDAGTTGAVRGTAAGVSFPTGSAGGGDPHNNMQPFIAINFIIKV